MTQLSKHAEPFARRLSRAASLSELLNVLYAVEFTRGAFSPLDLRVLSAQFNARAVVLGAPVRVDAQLRKCE